MKKIAGCDLGKASAGFFIATVRPDGSLEGGKATRVSLVRSIWSARCLTGFSRPLRAMQGPCCPETGRMDPYIWPDVRAVGLTGSGREAVATLARTVFPVSGESAADVIVLNEIVAHATAAIFCDPDQGKDIGSVPVDRRRPRHGGAPGSRAHRYRHHSPVLPVSPGGRARAGCGKGRVSPPLQGGDRADQPAFKRRLFSGTGPKVPALGRAFQNHQTGVP
jgi:hypothetical protein